jgi:transposase InsO family protein
MIWHNQRSPGPIPVRDATVLLDVSKSGYYAWLKRKGKNGRTARDRPVVEEMHKIAHENPGYGYRRITHHLHRSGICVNHKRVLRLMRENNLTFRRKKFSPITTVPEHANPVYPNLLYGLKVTRPNQVWAADFTYIQLEKEFVYLAVELDLYGRRVIGWSLSRNLDTGTALEALEMALYTRRDEYLGGLIHHSDRGRQYTSLEFTECLRNHGIQISNSRKGNPYDNAYVESFFKTLKYEEVYLNEYETFEDALENIGRFIEDVYNSKRMHSALGYVSPIEYEQKEELNSVAIL